MQEAILEKEYVLTGMPIPPSANEQHAFYRGRFIKTVKARKFDEEVKFYEYINKANILKIKKELNVIIELGIGLKVDCFFAFNTDRLIWKNKQTMRKIDSNNRFKSSLDAVSYLIGIDDSYFITGIAEKVECKLLSEKEQLIVKIRPYKMKSLSQIL